MARSRNIKPSFFDNDLLADNDALGRLLFIGLWTIADYKGDFEWRSKRIKAKLLPFDDCDINKLAINLDKSGFIRFYSNTDILYCRVLNFTKHQNPHKNEKDKGSDIPEYDETGRQLIDLDRLAIYPDKSRLNPEQDGTNPADSFNLIPDSLLTLYKPNPETLEFLRAHRLPIPKPENIAGFITHHEIKKTIFNDEREIHLWFRKWMAKEQSFVIKPGAHNGKSESASELHSRINADAFPT